MIKAHKYLHITPTTAFTAFRRCLYKNAYLIKRYCSGNFQLFIAPGISTVFRKSRALCKKMEEIQILCYSSCCLFATVFACVAFLLL